MKGYIVIIGMGQWIEKCFQTESGRHCRLIRGMARPRRAASERLHRLLAHTDRLVIDVPVIGEIREMVKG